MTTRGVVANEQSNQSGVNHCARVHVNKLLQLRLPWQPQLISNLITLPRNGLCLASLIDSIKSNLRSGLSNIVWGPMLIEQCDKQ